MKVQHTIFMTLSLTILLVGWVFAVIGVYYLGSSLIGYETTEDNSSLAAVWALLFSFGVVSVSVLLAAKADFAERAYVRKIYIYSIVATASLFLGYTVVGLLAGLYRVIFEP